MSKIKVLFLAANPRGSQLQLDKESREITARIQASEFRDSLDFVTRWAVRADDVQQALLEVKPHILHFSGHGTSNDEIVLVDDQGREKPVSKEALRHLLLVLKDNIRLVVLNACFSRGQAEAISEFIDCAVGMNNAVGDEAAITFISSFYRALGFGRSVEDAFQLGISSLRFEGIPEDKTPELLRREGVNTSQLYLISSQSSETKQRPDRRPSNIPASDEPLSVFISYCHRDEELRKSLDAHLSPLKRRGLLSVWTDHEITSGEEWNEVIAAKLDSARIILLLVSSDYLASDFCYENELAAALEKHERGEARVVPVILRPCVWQRETFAKLQALPKDAKPVTDWANADSAFLSIANGIERVAKQLRQS